MRNREHPAAKWNLNATCVTVPKIYLAGKITKDCWRRFLVGGLREFSWDDSPLSQPGFIYVGPFFVGCDHACFHGKDSHGAISPYGSGCHTDSNPLDYHFSQRGELVRRCLNAVSSADLLFCYITATDCFGTLVEIGAAIQANIPVAIVFAPGIAGRITNDFWFSSTLAEYARFNVKEADLPIHFNTVLERLKCKQLAR